MPEANAPQAAALFERGCELQGRRQLEAAIACYDQAISLEPAFAAAHSNRGAAFATLNCCDEALASLDEAIRLKPDHAEAHFSRAIVLLMQGNLLAGWHEFEWRWQTSPGRALRRSRNVPGRAWLGETDVAGRTVLLYSERGLGDSLQFCRYAPLVAQLGAAVILQVQAPLVRLLRGQWREVRVIDDAEVPPPVDVQCPLLSLPLTFKTSLQTMPASRRYLRAEPKLVSTMGAALDGASRPRVGLVWRGDAANPDDLQRSIALAELLPLLPSGVRYYSLQKELTVDERRWTGADRNLVLLGGELDFETTAALCENLDLVIAIDTSVAHLAAALGVRTWILLPFNADCRWLLDREDSPWYSAATLYRQKVAGDWVEVLARVRADLERLAASTDATARGETRSSPTSDRSS